MSDDRDVLPPASILLALLLAAPLWAGIAALVVWLT